MAEKAPPERNRYVDFLRALSILAVVISVSLSHVIFSFGVAPE